MDENQTRTAERVLAVLGRDNPAVLERALLIVQIEDLQIDNARLRAQLEPQESEKEN